MCYASLYQLQYGGSDDSGKKKFPQKQLADQPQFKEVMRIIEALRNSNSGKTVVHPKMERLRALLVDYFTNQEVGADAGPATAAKQSKVMVFVSYRSAVEEVIAELDKERPLIRAHKFIGQATGKGEGKGLTQKQQLQVCILVGRDSLTA